MYGIGWSSHTMTCNHHLMVYMDTHVNNNIMQAIVIFNVKFVCCCNECLFKWLIIVSQHIIRRHFSLDGHQSFSKEPFGHWNDLRFSSSFWPISKLHGSKICLMEHRFFEISSSNLQDSWMIFLQFYYWFHWYMVWLPKHGFVGSIWNSIRWTWKVLKNC